MMAVTAQMARVGVRRSGGLPQGHRRTGEGVWEVLSSDPFSGTLFVFQNRRGTAIKILAYDGQGFWLALKRLSGEPVPVLARRGRLGAAGAVGAPTPGAARGRRCGGDLRRADVATHRSGGLGSGVGAGDHFRAYVLSAAVLFVGHERRVDAQGGRAITEEDIAAIRALMSERATWTRRSLSLTLCERRGWSCRRTVRHGTRGVSGVCSLRFIVSLRQPWVTDPPTGATLARTQGGGR